MGRTSDPATREENPMTPTYVLLYVENPTRSSEFYGRLLGLAPVEASANFAMFVLPSGVKLGLWARGDVAPAATRPGGTELAFTEPSVDAVRARHDPWRTLGIVIAQEVTAMDFGTTFVGLDPDGHRLRVFAPPA
jgi:catechol 2,3-dioxygenase-like lactoylglutathione lyase family enzyme